MRLDRTVRDAVYYSIWKLQNVRTRNIGIIIFRCKTNLKILSTAEWIYMDGTFEDSFKFFLQLFTIHGYLNGHYIPLVFCLLKAKTQNIYRFF